MFRVLKAAFVGGVTLLEVVGRPDVYHLLVVEIQGCFVDHWLLALPLYRAEVFVAAVTGFMSFGFVMLFR